MYLLITLGWIAYFALHSILASNAIKNWLYIQIPIVKKYYRLCYNFIALSGLVVLLQLTFKDNQLLVHTNNLQKLFAIICIVIGLIILSSAFMVFDKLEFIGLKKPEDSVKDLKLILSGIYKYMRHPLYSGTFFLLVGLIFFKPTLGNILFFVISIIYIEIGSRLEEKKLTEFFGNDYIIYTKQVKRYFPFIY